MKILYTETGSTGKGGSFKSLTEIISLLEGELDEVWLVHFNPSAYFDRLPSKVRLVLIQDPLFSLGHPWHSTLAPIYYKLTKHFPSFRPAMDNLIHRKALKIIGTLIQNNRPDVIHCNNQPRRDEFLLRLARQKGVPCLSHIRTQHAEGQISFTSKSPLLFACVSGSVKETWTRHGVPEDKSEVLHNFIPHTSLRRLEKTPFPSLAYLGRLIPKKGLDLLFQALPELKRLYPRLEVFIMGEGPLKEDLEQEADLLNGSGWIHLMGHVASPLEKLSSAHLMVMASEDEGFGKVLIESMSAGTCVVTYPSGGIKEIVTDNVNGHFMSDLTPGALITAVRKVLDDEGHRQKLRSNGFKTAEEEFSAGVFKNRILALYQKLLA